MDSAATPWIADTKSGVYFGWASLALPPGHPDRDPAATAAGGFSVFPMVMSIGYNPFYKNTVRSAEVHVLHAFRADFYGTHMRLAIAGFIRDELDYSGLEALIADINLDCDVARNSLDRAAWTPKGLVSGKAGTLDGAWLVRESSGGE